jgi:tripeptidyl-peptidase-1
MMVTDRHSWVPHGTHPKLRSINGAYGPTNNTALAGDEADLDFEVAIPLVWPQKTVLFQTDDEWYQRDQSRAGSKYPGYFNSALPPPSLPTHTPLTPY